MQHKEIFEPAFPTTPVQNQFGQIVMFMGLSKIELLTAIIKCNSDASIDDCYSIAETIINKCYAKAKESNDNTSSAIING